MKIEDPACPKTWHSQKKKKQQQQRQKSVQCLYKIASKPPEARRHGTDSPSQYMERTNSATIPDF